jgi:threonine/homoserine/homoserine lactone efflux protein
MFEPLLYGLTTGAVMSVMLGTVFFALVQNSIDNGFRSGMLISMGVIVSDILLISLSLLFSSALLPTGGTVEYIVRIAGGVFLIAYGISNLMKKKTIVYPESGPGQVLYSMSTGFFLNLLNPGNFIGWTAVSTQLTQVAGYNIYQSIIFYSGALSAIFMTETLIAYGATQLKQFITVRLLRNIDITVGILFLCFAIFLLWPVVTGF